MQGEHLCGAQSDLVLFLILISRMGESLFGVVGARKARGGAATAAETAAAAAAAAFFSFTRLTHSTPQRP